MKLRSAILALLLAVALAPLAVSQGSNGGILYASDFGKWNLPQGTGPAAGSISWPDASICRVSSNGYNFNAPKVGRKLLLVDTGTPPHTEVITPSQVIVGPGGCSITAPMTYSHFSYNLVSGTGGLQEAIDYGTIQQQGGLVYLTPQWTLYGGTTGMITAAYGVTKVSIFDARTACITAYLWNGSAYVIQPTFCGGGSPYPAGSGIPQIVAGTSWGATYNAGNLIPANFLPLATSSTFGTIEPDNSTCTVTAGVLSCAGTGSTSFHNITSGTNTSASMIVATGASLTPGGTGIIQATNIQGTVTAGTNVTVTGSGTTGSPYVVNSSAGSTGVPSVNSITSAVTVAGDPTVHVDTTGSTITVHDNLPFQYGTTAVWAADSRLLDDTGNTLGATVTVTAVSCAAGGICTLTATNTYTANQYVNLTQVTSPACLTSTSGLSYYGTGTNLFQVLSAGLSGSQFEVQTGCGATTGTGGTAEDATYFVPVKAMTLPAFAGVTSWVLRNGIDAGSIYGGTTGMICEMNTNYTNMFHSLSPAVTGKPAWIISAGAGLNDASEGQNTAAIEACYTAFWQKAHVDGYKILQGTVISGTVTATNYDSVLNPVSAWIPTQGKSTTNAAAGGYWDGEYDPASFFGHPTSTYFSSNQFNVSGAAIAAAFANSGALGADPAQFTCQAGTDCPQLDGSNNQFTGNTNSFSGFLIQALGNAGFKQYWTYGIPSDTTDTYATAQAVSASFNILTNKYIFMTNLALNGLSGTGVLCPNGTSNIFTQTGCTIALATAATNLSGGALGSAPYQSAANTTAFIASPTTSGHTFLYAWQPSGSAIAPAAIDANTLANGLSGMTAGQVPIAATATTVTSSEALAGAGAGITTGPVSGTTANDVATMNGTNGQIKDSGTLITALAPLASPTFTGTPAAPTATGGTNTTQLATTAFVQAAIAAAGTGAGIVTYSGPSLTFSGTQYFPIGGGASSSTTETNVDIDSPAAVTIQNMTVQMSAAPGVGNSVVYTWRKNAADTVLTCTISGASATSCSDTTHNFSTASLDLLDIKAVTTGTIVGTPTVIMAAQVGVAAPATGVTSVSNSDGTLTISPTTGAVVASIALGHANTWTAAQALGSSTATTQSANDNSTKLATTAYVDGKSRAWSCQPGLGDGLNAIPAGTYLSSTCMNTTGSTVTLTSLKCFTDNSGTSTMNAAGNTLGALLTGAVTCTSSFASGTQSANVALTNGDYIKFTFVADGTSKQATFVAAGTY